MSLYNLSSLQTSCPDHFSSERPRKDQFLSGDSCSERSKGLTKVCTAKERWQGRVEVSSHCCKSQRIWKAEYSQQQWLIPPSQGFQSVICQRWAEGHSPSACSFQPESQVRNAVRLLIRNMESSCSFILYGLIQEQALSLDIHKWHSGSSQHPSHFHNYNPIEGCPTFPAVSESDICSLSLCLL